MYLVKFNGGIKHRTVTILEQKPPSHLFVGDTLYSLLNSQLVSEPGYKETYNYGEVKYLTIEK